MHQLLASVEAISSCRDRDTLGAHLVAAVAAVLGGGRVLLFAAEGLEVSGWQLGAAAGAPDDGDAALAAQCALLADRALRQREPAVDEQDGQYFVAFPLCGEDRSRGGRVLLFAASASPDGGQLEQIAWLLRIYGNYLGLIDYSETDTLTSLLNRKTFDESFDRLLEARPTGRAFAAQERRQAGEVQHWLAVADVDHFKHVNDNFGHLFGDEVLIRVANVMRGAFRDSDRLFRFGGEEFVILLQVAEQDHAFAAADRFREAIAAHEFPQVGRVTCSLGLTRVSHAEVPSDVIGRADQALYYAKNNGRNQVCVYEDLIAAGVLSRPAGAAIEPDFDIDALFS